MRYFKLLLGALIVLIYFNLIGTNMPWIMHIPFLGFAIYFIMTGINNIQRKPDERSAQEMKVNSVIGEDLKFKISDEDVDILSQLYVAKIDPLGVYYDRISSMMDEKDYISALNIIEIVIEKLSHLENTFPQQFANIYKHRGSIQLELFSDLDLALQNYKKSQKLYIDSLESTKHTDIEFKKIICNDIMEISKKLNDDYNLAIYKNKLHELQYQEILSEPFLMICSSCPQTETEYIELLNSLKIKHSYIDEQPQDDNYKRIYFKASIGIFYDIGIVTTFNSSGYLESQGYYFKDYNGKPRLADQKEFLRFFLADPQWRKTGYITDTEIEIVRKMDYLRLSEENDYIVVCDYIAP